MPEDGLEQLRGRDAILLGAVGDPRVPDHLSLWGLLIPIRRTFDQYVNLRPVRVFPGVRSPLADPGDFDVVIVRENVEGEYSEAGGRVYRGHAEELAIQESVFTRRGITRIAEYAFALAERRGGGLTSATKSNGIVHTLPFWDEVVREVAAAHPDVRGRRGAHRRALREGRHAARPLRRHRRVEPLRRHPLRPHRGRRGLDRDRAVGEPQPGARVPLDVRARPRLGARHRGPGHREPDRDALVRADDARAPRPRGRGGRAHGGDRGVAGRPGVAHARPRRRGRTPRPPSARCSRRRRSR